MVSMKLLRAAGFTPEKLKKKFTEQANSDGIRKLLQIIQSRVINGRTQNLSTFRTYWALDCSYNAPYYQTQTALIQELMGRLPGMSYSEACSTCKSFGISEENLFYTPSDQSGKPLLDQNNQPIKRLKQQAFFKTLVPLVRSYLIIRWAKLFNDRNLSPLFKYEPISFTSEKRALCEIVTDLIERMSRNYGYSSRLKQAIFQQLLYGWCVQFVKEPWHKQPQLADAEEYVVEAGDSLGRVADRFNVTLKELRKVNSERQPGKLRKGERLNIPPRVTCAKQGLRYDTPHPTRCFFDLSEPTDTINTDTGVSFAAYWRVMKYGELEADPDIWNKEAIPFGTNDWFNWNNGAARAFWENVYPCQMRFPQGAVFAGATDSMQRESRLMYNVSNDQDSPVFVTNMVMKIVPSRYGLADYDYPVWVRFLVANDNTVLWCDVCPYTPITYLGYDADNNRWPNASMALEILPFQVQLGNILSQILFTAKQALRKIVPYDTQQVEESVIRELNNAGDEMYAGLTMLPFDSIKAKFGSQTTPTDMFKPIELGQHSSAEMTGQINVIIDILERLLGMSSQEVGSAATHEQSATETRVISENTTIRVDFTGSFVDDYIKAWKEQLYYATMAFMDDEFISQVYPTADTLAALKKLGFDVPEAIPGNAYGTEKISVHVQKEWLVLDGFASDRDGANRINDPQVAAVILQGVQSIVNNPMLAQAVGAQPILDIITNALVLAGGPKDLRFRVDPNASAQMQMQQVQAQLGDVEKQILAQVGEGMKPLADAIKQGQQQDAQIAQAVQASQQQMQQIAQAIGPITEQIKALSEGLIQNSQRDQQFAQIAVQGKQEADALANTVLQLKGLVTQLVQHSNPGAMPAPEPLAPGQPTG